MKTSTKIAAGIIITGTAFYITTRLRHSVNNEGCTYTIAKTKQWLKERPQWLVEKAAKSGQSYEEAVIRNAIWWAENEQGAGFGKVDLRKCKYLKMLPKSVRRHLKQIYKEKMY